MKRSERLKIIRKIISSNKITSQDHLMTELKSRGFNVTQSTVSRDINFLNLVKVRDAEEKEYYALNKIYPADPKFDTGRIKIKFKENVVSVERAINIIVVKTNPGEAQGVAAVIDGSNFEPILGTVAGDDTIICVVDNETSAKEMVDFFKKL